VLSLVTASDVKVHEIFGVKYFVKYFKNFTMFFGQYTHLFNIFHTSNITFHSFTHTAAPSAYLQAYLLGLLV